MLYLACPSAETKRWILILNRTCCSNILITYSKNSVIKWREQGDHDHMSMPICNAEAMRCVWSLFWNGKHSRRLSCNAPKLRNEMKKLTVYVPFKRHYDWQDKILFSFQKNELYATYRWPISWAIWYPEDKPMSWTTVYAFDEHILPVWAIPNVRHSSFKHRFSLKFRK